MAIGARNPRRNVPDSSSYFEYQCARNAIAAIFAKSDGWNVSTRKSTHRRAPLILQPDVRHETKRQQDRRSREPDPACPLPELVIDHRARHARHHPHPQPERLPFEKVNRVPMAILRERPGAEEHHDAEHDQRRHGQDQEIDAFAMHGVIRPIGPIAHVSAAGCSSPAPSVSARSSTSSGPRSCSAGSGRHSHMQLPRDAHRRIAAHHGISRRRNPAMPRASERPADLRGRRRAGGNLQALPTWMPPAVAQVVQR